jgi:glycosyltransferase involved in cell wall biosynthesis
LVYTSHTRFDVYAHVHTPWVPAANADQLVARFMRMVSRNSDAIIVPSLGSAEAHARWGVTDRVHHIPNGVDLSSFVAPQVADRDALGIPADAPVAVYVGRFHLEKNVHGLINAYRIACQSESQSRLLLVGDGPKLESIRNMVADYGLTERVVFAGLRPYDEVPGLLAASDFLVSASTSETHPLTFIEAAAAGLPALGISSPGIADIVVDGETGLLANESGDEFARHFVSLASDAGLRRELGRKARIHSHAFSAQATAEAVATLYEGLLASREPGIASLPPS